MPSPLIRYQLDPTGNNPDNLILGETKIAMGGPVTRVIAPTYAPFFSDSVKVYNSGTNQELVKNVQYKCVELLQDPTARYAKEICQIILILDPSVANLRYDYQALGGLNQFDPSVLVNLWTQATQDNRPVQWGNVLNKPISYPPSLHNHMFSELYGFEPLVMELERVRNAITLSNVPAFESLIDWVKLYIKPTVSEEEIRDSLPVQKYVTFEKLLYALDQLNFNGVKMSPLTGTFTNRSNQAFQLEFTNPPQVPLFWTIDHIETDSTDFLSDSGLVVVQDDRASFTISLSGSKVDETPESFKVSIRKNSITGPVLKQTQVMQIRAYEAPRTLDYFTACCIYNSEITAESMYVISSYS
jgi:hypothetical protein